MRLAETTWPHVARYLEGCKGIIIPVGSTEQHGPCGPIGTDALVAQAIAEQAARHGPWLVAPTLSLAPAQFNLAFAGTISLRASTLMAVVGDVLSSRASSAFTSSTATAPISRPCKRPARTFTPSGAWANAAARRLNAGCDPGGTIRAPTR
jgi:creatinine amidohydrolase/Fe(II)-dependent formamide hydrolase-like protein